MVYISMDSSSDKKFIFSIVMAVYNVEDYVSEAIDSIITQDIGFEENVQIILVDDGSKDNSKKICLKYQKQYPKNIIFISIPNNGQGNARNIGLKYVEGQYVNFLDSDDYLSKNTLSEVEKYFKKYGEKVDIISIPLILFGRQEGQHRLNYKYKNNRLIDLKKEPNNPQLSASSIFVRYEAIGDLRFSCNVISSEDAIFINKILLKKMTLGVINTGEYYYRQRFDQSSTIDTSIYNKKYYNERLEHYFKHLIKYSLKKVGYIPSFIQYTLAYDFQWLFKLDSFEIFDTDDEIEEFWDSVNYVTDCIGNNAIIHNRNIEKRFVSFFMFLRQNEYHLEKDELGKIYLKSKNYTIDCINKHNLWLDHIEIIDNNLKISGFFVSHFDYEFIEVYATVKSENKIMRIKGTQFKYGEPNRDIINYLSINWKYCLNFDLNIPLSEEDSIIDFTIVFKEDKYSTTFTPKLSLNDNCGLSTSSAYFIKNDKIVLLKFGKLNILNYSYPSVLRYEFSNIKKICKDRQDGFLYAVFIRFLFIILYPFYRNNEIWLFADRPNVADDNAIQLYKYALTKKDKIKKYFVIDKKCNSYKEIKHLPNIIQFKSLKHKILFLLSDKHICSYVNNDFINPIEQSKIELYEGMITTEKYFLQHGIIKDDVSLNINRYKKNLRLFLTSADLEKKSIIEGKYNYDEKIVQALGLPRYDNLDSSNEIKKQILFMPTWRMGIINEESFLKSDYYKELSFILNNDILDKLFEKKGYDLIFKPHPELVKYINLLKLGKYVKLAVNDKYQKLFNESALLITDYSSVFFDFAYLKKPVIYYQINNDYHYDEGYFSYEKMGFGDVIKDNITLINKIKFYLSNNCKMESKYKKRVNKFYKYHDKNNSQRVYEWIYKN